MNKTNHLVGAGIALIAGSVLAAAPLVAATSTAHPARICIDNGSTNDCESIVRPSALPGGSGQEVAVRPSPTVRIDAKDHPNYGQITPEVRGDTKDHPNYGQVTSEVRGDAKDHPNYGQVTSEVRGDAKDHPNYGSATASGGGGSVTLSVNPTYSPR